MLPGMACQGSQGEEHRQDPCCQTRTLLFKIFALEREDIDAKCTFQMATAYKWDSPQGVGLSENTVGNSVPKELLAQESGEVRGCRAFRCQMAFSPLWRRKALGTALQLWAQGPPGKFLLPFYPPGAFDGSSPEPRPAGGPRSRRGHPGSLLPSAAPPKHTPAAVLLRKAFARPAPPPALPSGTPAGTRPPFWRQKRQQTPTADALLAAAPPRRSPSPAFPRGSRRSGSAARRPRASGAEGREGCGAGGAR